MNIKKTQTVTVTSKTSNKTLSDTKKVLKPCYLIPENEAVSKQRLKENSVS